MNQQHAASLCFISVFVVGLLVKLFGSLFFLFFNLFWFTQKSQGITGKELL